jgi:uncharacterized protein YjbJ (UPF0337 family)
MPIGVLVFADCEFLEWLIESINPRPVSSFLLHHAGGRCHRHARSRAGGRGLDPITVAPRPRLLSAKGRTRPHFQRSRTGLGKENLWNVEFRNARDRGSSLNWKQLKGNVKAQWGKLTDDDLDVIAGKRDQHEGKIQERYGLEKDKVKSDVDTWYNRQTW